MAFALCPDGGPSRIIRPTVLDATGLVALLDAEKNILFVDRELFDGLNRAQQEIVLRTHEREVWLKDLPTFPNVEYSYVA